jgi:hypothetical protein
LPFKTEVNHRPNRARRHSRAGLPPAPWNTLRGQRFWITGRGSWMGVLVAAILILSVGRSGAEVGGKTPPPPEWHDLGRPVKASRSVYVEVDASRHALNPSLALSDASLSLGWIELNAHGVSQIFFGHWSPSGWVRNGGVQNRDASHRALELTMGSDGHVPYLAWVEQNRKNIPELYVKYLRGGRWISDIRSLNLDPAQPALNPSLSASGSAPCLAWSERDPNRVFQLYVKCLSGDDWKRAGDRSLNISSRRDAMRPAIVLSGLISYVAWTEPTDRNVYQVHVKRWNGSTWEQLGGSLNLNPQNHALSPSLVLIDQIPHAAWIEFDANGVSQLHVKHWEKNTWMADGGVLNADPARHAFSPAMGRAGSRPYVAWTEYDGEGRPRIHVKYHNGTRWVPDDPRSDAKAAASSDPILTGTDAGVSIAWKEVDPNGVAQIVVQQIRIR